MNIWLSRIINVVKRPESKLAAGLVLFGVSVAMLINVTLVSCEEVGGGGSRPGLAGSAGSAITARADGGGVEPGQGPRPTTGKADFRVSSIVAEPEMRVRVQTGATSIKLTRIKDVRIMPSGLDGSPLGPGNSYTGETQVRRDGDGWMVGFGSDASRLVSDLGVVAQSAVRGQGLTVNGVTYPGRLRLVPRSDLGPTLFDVVEHIALEDYLPGVVAKEMLAGWPLGAYQVQAVCARTYALHEKLRTAGNSKAHFDVESSDRDQVYSGATGNRAAIEAVRSTRGWVLADGDQVLRAYFSSTCGGRTASAKDTWPTGPGFEYNLAGPIQARPRESACDASPLFRWSVTRDRGELVQRLRTYGERSQLLVRKIRDVWTIEPMALNADGRPSAYKVIEPGGVWYQLSGEQLRLALNQSVPTPAAGVLGASVPAIHGFDAASATAEEAEAAPPPPVPIVIPDIDRKSRVASSDLEVAGPRGGPTATIRGRGFGHGVGMCQYCAKAFADRGEDWRTAVLRFYPGARLTPLY